MGEGHFALFTFRYLELLEELEKAFSEIITSQSTQDEIMQTISALHIGVKKGHMSVGKMGEKYVREEVPPEDIQKKIDFLNDIKGFITNKTTGVSRQYSEQEEQIKQIMTRQVVDNLLLSKEKNIPLCCDDRAVNCIGKNDYSINCSTSCYVLVKMLEKRIIDEATYYEKLFSLIELSYSYISIKPEMMTYFLRKEKYVVGEKTAKLLKIIESLETSENSAIEFMATVIRDIWLEPIPPRIKYQILDEALRSLTGQRNIRKIAERFITVLKPKFQLLPIHILEVEKNVKNWVKSQGVIY